MTTATSTRRLGKEGVITAAEPLGVPGLPPVHLLTAAEYAKLGEIGWGYTELMEGRILVSPSPTAKHNMAGLALAMQLVPQLPDTVRVIQDVDIDLRLVPADQPGLVRRPDLVVVDTKAVNRVDRDGGLLGARDVLVVVEIVSQGSHRLDYVTKRGEYADAGIPHYWIVDLDEPVSLLDCHLAEDFGCADSGAITGTFTVSEPFSVHLELDLLI